MNTEMVKKILSQYSTLKGEFDLRRTVYPDRDLDEAGHLLKKRIEVIEGMLLLLTDEERFVVTKHLVDKLSWPLILVEYGRRWGEVQVRHERTLKRFQSKALEKIAAGIEKWKMVSEIETLFNNNDGGGNENGYEH